MLMLMRVDSGFSQSDLFGDLSKIINEPDSGRLL